MLHLLVLLVLPQSFVPGQAGQVPLPRALLLLLSSPWAELCAPALPGQMVTGETWKKLIQYMKSFISLGTVW